MDVQMPLMDGFQATAAIRALQGDEGPGTHRRTDGPCHERRRATMPASRNGRVPAEAHQSARADRPGRAAWQPRRRIESRAARRLQPLPPGRSCRSDRSSRSRQSGFRGRGVRGLQRLEEAMQRCFGQTRNVRRDGGVFLRARLRDYWKRCDSRCATATEPRQLPRPINSAERCSISGPRRP